MRNREEKARSGQERHAVNASSKKKKKQNKYTRTARVTDRDIHRSTIKNVKKRHQSAMEWLEDYGAVTNHLGQFDFDKLLEKGQGLCRIENFLPEHVADYISDTLKRIPQEKWLDTAAEEDDATNNIRHAFFSTKEAGPALEAILRLFSVIFPDDLSVFSAAKYMGQHSHCITRHDDRAYVPVKMEDTGQVVSCSRDVAIIYYLGDGDTKEWRKDMGGLLIDCEDGDREYMPQFNSCIMFTIPRYHIVTPVVPPHNRYSIFGWTLQPGKMYELYQSRKDNES
jgi:Rps23 Pro-64 3,4-dihydroxylase Tpa1-like proline 4-hydroxylase